MLASRVRISIAVGFVGAVLAAASWGANCSYYCRNHACVGDGTGQECTRFFPTMGYDVFYAQFSDGTLYPILGEKVNVYDECTCSDVCSNVGSGLTQEMDNCSVGVYVHQIDKKRCQNQPP